MIGFSALIVLLFITSSSSFIHTNIHRGRRATSQPLHGKQPLSALVAVKQEEPTLDSRIKNPVSSIILPLILAASLFVSPVAFADSGTSSVFTSDYADPLHPQCRRHIEVSADGNSFHYSGTAVGPLGDPVLRGCSPKEIKEFGIRQGSFDGVITWDPAAQTFRISVDDGIHQGVWEPAGTATTHLGYEDVNGIRWKDGNKWIVQPKTLAVQAGEVLTFSYIGFSLLAGVKGMYNMYQKKMEEAS
jgi:hypothetical protein